MLVTFLSISTTIFLEKYLWIVIFSGAKHGDNGDVLLCGGRIGDGEVMSDCLAYTPRTKVVFDFKSLKMGKIIAYY